MHNLRQKRIRRAKKTRSAIQEKKGIRLSVHRTNLHIYAQIVDTNKNKILTSSSTLERDVRCSLSKCSNVQAATLIGERIAQKAKLCGIKTVSFDRSGYKYHGRVKALAEAARANGLAF